MSQVEETVGELKFEITSLLVESMVEVQERRQMGPGPRCERCGGEMYSKGNRRRRVVTSQGEIEMDGAMVYILNEEWKEVKVGCVFEYETHLEYCRKTQEHKEVVKAENQSYAAYLGEPEPFAKLLSAEAERRGYDRAQQRACVGDGAKWIWTLWSLCFPTAQGIVDWPHAVEHLWTAAHLAETMDSAQLKRWVKGCKDELWLGHVQTVTTNILALADDHPAQAA